MESLAAKAVMSKNMQEQRKSGDADGLPSLFQRKILLSRSVRFAA